MSMVPGLRWFALTTTFLFSIPLLLQPASAGGGNSAPSARVTGDTSVAVGATVHLDGSRSSDPDGDPLTFSWEILSRPAGSNATLSDASAVMPFDFLRLP